MGSLISINDYPISCVLKILLQDKTTKQNIIWGTDEYSDLGPEFGDKSQITEASILGMYSVDIKPRISKTLEAQQERTRKKAEVMTPVWLCNKMNNYADEQWFGRKNIFNKEKDDNSWAINKKPIAFTRGRKWQDYVDSRRLEITCGEAPYLVSRYDTTTGELIVPPIMRIGMLDRKLRIVNENTTTEEEWLTWAERAVQSCYGYEWQGDNLLIARCNILLSYVEYYEERFEKKPGKKLLNHITNIISWNLWQMDGLKDTVPLGKPAEDFHEPTLFELYPEAMFATPPSEEESIAPYCKIYDWRANKAIEFRKCKEM